jgi:hypothetical protein
MKMKNYQLTQQEFDEYCAEYEQWCDEQTARWGYEYQPCEQELQTQAGYTIHGVLSMAALPVKITLTSGQ